MNLEDFQIPYSLWVEGAGGEGPTSPWLRLTENE